MKRGDVIVVSVAGDYAKLRPAIIIQSDKLNENANVLVALLTTVLVDTSFYRLNVEPTPQNGLKLSSQIMVDKITAYPREKCGPVIGAVDQATLIKLNNMLAVMVGIAD